MRNFILAAIVLSGAAIAFAQVAPPAGGAVPPVSPAAATSTATTAKAEQELQKAEKDRFEAMVKADGGELDKLLGAELSYTHSNGKVQDKPGFIGDIRSKAIRYVSIEPSDVHVVLFGTTAVVTGNATMHVMDNGNDRTVKLRYTDVHLNRRGEWQLVAWQATPVN